MAFTGCLQYVHYLELSANIYNDEPISLIICQVNNRSLTDDKNKDVARCKYFVDPQNLKLNRVPKPTDI